VQSGGGITQSVSQQQNMRKSFLQQEIKKPDSVSNALPSIYKN
jgi:hypothetical protein